MDRSNNKVIEKQGCKLVDCKFKDICSSYPHRCHNCSNNKNSKEDYYSPRNYGDLQIPNKLDIGVIR